MTSATCCSAFANKRASQRAVSLPGHFLVPIHCVVQWFGSRLCFLSLLVFLSLAWLWASSPMRPQNSPVESCLPPCSKQPLSFLSIYSPRCDHEAERSKKGNWQVRFKTWWQQRPQSTQRSWKMQALPDCRVTKMAPFSVHKAPTSYGKNALIWSHCRTVPVLSDWRFRFLFRHLHT